MLTAIPKAITTPRELRLYAPAPVAWAIGKTPKTNAKEVIRIGRSRWRAASLAESMMLIPCFSISSTPNSTIRMAFFVSKPISITKPICPNTSSGISSIQSPTMAPKVARGTVRMMTMGRIQLS